MSKNAFPTALADIEGLTKRELFAAMMLQALISAPIGNSDYGVGDPEIIEINIDLATEYACKLIRELDQE